MTTAVGSIVGIKPEPEVDGSHMIQVADFGEEPFEVMIHAFQLPDFVRTLQEGLVRRAVTTQLPEFEVASVALAHQGMRTALMVDSPQIGRIALHASAEVLQQLRSEIDRALAYIESLSRPQ